MPLSLRARIVLIFPLAAGTFASLLQFYWMCFIFPVLFMTSRRRKQQLTWAAEATVAEQGKPLTFVYTISTVWGGKNGINPQSFTCLTSVNKCLLCPKEMTDFTARQFLWHVGAVLRWGELEGVMLLLTDQRLSCGFWTALSSLLSTLFWGVSPDCCFFSSAVCQEFVCTHTHNRTHTCIFK